MKKIVQFSVDYPVTILMLVLGVLLLGYISFTRLGMDLYPEMQSPKIYVEITSGERPPEEMERQFVKDAEALASRQKGAVHVSSVCRVGFARVTVEYAWGTDMDEAFLSVQKSLGDLKQNTEIDELTVSRQDPNATPVIVVGLSNPQIDDMDELRRVAENYIRNELVRLEGIADVKLLGQEEKEVQVQTDDYLLQAHNLTQSDVASKIGEYNRSISGGSLVEMGTKYVIKGVSEFTSLDDIGNVVLAWKDESTASSGSGSTASPAAGAAAGGSTSVTDQRTPVLLKDIATITLAAKKPDNIVYLDGKRAMALAVYKETRFNTVKAVEQFNTALKTLRQALPGYELTVIENSGQFISGSVDELEQSALYGILLAVIVLFVFLRRVGATLIISLAIPISIVATFNLMYFNGLTLNLMTLGGLALGAGMLVDNAIVVMENISRHLDEGRSLREAAVLGTSQVGGAIIASTVTTVVVFLPIVYLQGFSGELFKDQAWTVAFSLLSSLVVAILVMPMLATRLLGRKGRPEDYDSRALQFSGYPRLLSGLVARPWSVIGAALALIALTAAFIPKLKSEFIPRTDLGDYTVDLHLPEGTELYRTAGTVNGIEKQIHELLGGSLRSLYSISGKWRDTEGDISEEFEDENTATIRVFLNRDSSLTTEQAMARTSSMLGQIPDLEARVYQEQTTLQMGTGSEQAPVVLEIRGEDLDRLKELTFQARDKLAAIDGLENLQTNFDQGRPEIEIVLDRIRAGLYDIGVQSVSTRLKNILSGADAGTWETGGEERNITVKLPQASVNSLDMIQVTQGNNKISLYEVADVRQEMAPVAIYREDQERCGTVSAHLSSRTTIDRAAESIRASLAGVDFPPEYSWRLTGEERDRQESFASLKFALWLSLILVYRVLASQFESLVQPFTIVLSIPLAFVGALGIFLILGRPLNIMAYIGIIMLAGIAVNNAIILVDAIGQLRREGLARHEAILEAGRRRIRPILMTSLTTILALLPLTFGFGEGASLRAPMALAVIGGMVTSTALTLVVIPCVYLVFDRLVEALFPGRADHSY
ncbi:efflux RND transporter permease subunit [bacterium]|nr:efflux RND transporter permease subunit [bacterium]